MNPLSRFWKKVDTSGDCWEWKAALSPQGYGAFFTKGNNYGAHRFAYEASVGPIPEGLQLDHLCRNRACVNPDHLEPVTIGENLRRGDGTKLTPQDVIEIRGLMEQGWLQCDIAAAYGIAKSCVTAIKQGTTWGLI